MVFNNGCNHRTCTFHSEHTASVRSPSMSQTNTSKHSQRSSHNPYRNCDDKTSVNPFLDDKEADTQVDQAQLSPMFVDYLRKKTASPDIDLEKTNVISDISDKYRGIKITHSISPDDGKTTDCDRRHTFDTFVDQRRISDNAGQSKRVGHGWQIARALKRVLSSKDRDTRKARQHEAALPQGLAT